MFGGPSKVAITAFEQALRQVHSRLPWPELSAVVMTTAAGSLLAAAAASMM